MVTSSNILFVAFQCVASGHKFSNASTNEIIRIGFGGQMHTHWSQRSDTHTLTRSQRSDTHTDVHVRHSKFSEGLTPLHVPSLTPRPLSLTHQPRSGHSPGQVGPALCLLPTKALGHFPAHGHPLWGQEDKGGGRERQREKDTSHSLAGRPQLMPMVWLELTCSGFFTQKTVLASCWSALHVGECAEPAREGWCPLGMEGRTRPQLRPLQGVGVGPKLGPRRPLPHVLCLLL